MDVGRNADRLMTKLMGRLARVPLVNAWAGGVMALVAIVLLDAVGRTVDVRLVPLYVPTQCLVFWALGRRPAVLFAVAAAIIAILPDMMSMTDPIGPATVANAAVRALAYVFLALIVTAYRRSYDEADMRAMYDGLTGVLNKLPFQVAIERQLADARRSHRTLLIAYVDLDDFKAVNTMQGHAAGDGVLRAFSREAMAAVRGSDVVGRLGGDEFGFMMVASSVLNAEALAHLLHQRLDAALGKTGLRLSCSMGALIVPPHAELSANDLLHMADHVMLGVKSDGKGRVVTRRALVAG